MNLTEHITSRALELGFDLVGIASAGVAPHAREYAAWISSGMMGEMAYMARDPDRRSDFRRVLPNAQSVIVVGLNYYTIDLPDEVKNDPSRGLIARYAWGVDYHEVMTPRLEELAQFVREPHPPTTAAKSAAPAASPDFKSTNQERGSGRSPLLKTVSPFSGESHGEASHGSGVRTMVYVDTGPVLERDWALIAGLGFSGKNTCLINPRMGSWLFLGVIITDADLQPAVVGVETCPCPPQRGGGPLGAAGLSASADAEPAKASTPKRYIGCGACTRCLTACPTNAFPAPHVLDARKCISYLTIELKGSIPIELRPLIGNRIFGCDICQDVCPWPTRFAAPTKERSFYPAQWPSAIDVDRAAPKLVDLAQLSEEEFQRRFAGTPLLRSKRRGLLRNVAVALGNWGSAEAREALEMLARDPDPIIAEHAQWGLRRC